MSGVRVRRDVWELGDTNDPWRDPALLAYAHAVDSMQALARSEPSNGANWVNQAAIHERRGEAIRGRIENQCQHASWFFLPWHRMYLYWFEQIIRSRLGRHAGDWALPYWNYTTSKVKGSRAIPPAFRQEHLPDGKSNPLFIAERKHTAQLDINRGDGLKDGIVQTRSAMAEGVFSRGVTGATGGFGGRRTSPLFHHDPFGLGAGVLEGTPHGSVHTEVGGRGGFMSSFSTAALDPIFWLHHANLDRVWEEWRRDRGGGRRPGSNPTDPDWLNMRFDFVDAKGRPLKMAVSKVLDIEAQLDYTYSHLPAPAPPPAPAPERRMTMAAEEAKPDHPAEMIGASEEPVRLEGRTTAASFAVSPPAGPSMMAAQGEGEPAAPASTYLNIENVRGEANPGLVYGVYLNLPEGEAAEPDSESFVGNISLFGIEGSQVDDGEEEAPHGLHYAFDVSEQVEALRQADRWNPDSLDVTFSPVGIDSEAEAELSVPGVVIGRVSLFVE